MQDQISFIEYVDSFKGLLKVTIFCGLEKSFPCACKRFICIRPFRALIYSTFYVDFDVHSQWVSSVE